MPSRASTIKDRQKKGMFFIVPKPNEKCMILFQFPGTPSPDISIFKNLFQERELKGTRCTSIKVLKKKKKKLATEKLLPFLFIKLIQTRKKS